MTTYLDLRHSAGSPACRHVPSCPSMVAGVELCTHRFTNADTWGDDMKAIKVGIREFRADLADYIASNTPVAVTRHGQTVGYFVPAQGQNEGDLAALKKAGMALDLLLAEKQIDVEELVSDFKEARKPTGSRKRAKAA